MPDLKEQVSDAIKSAMKEKNKTKLNALRYLKKLFIENDTSKSPVPYQDIVISYVKKLKDSLSMYPENSTQYEELVGEIEVLSTYMPQELSENEVIEIINKIIESQENAQFGNIMKDLSPQIKGRFDGRKATDLVKKQLS